MIYLIVVLLVLNTFATQKQNQEENVNTHNAFIEVLHSDGRSAEIRSESDIYGWLIGSWKIRAVDYGENGSKKETPAEWHFARVLEGRAIQDVFIVPSRDKRNFTTPKEGNRYGTSLRYYDSEADVWHITWTNPVRRVENRLIGRKVGNEIIQEGKDSDGSLMRWCFRDITPDTFRWTGEASPDQGKTWRLGAEFFAVRIKDHR